MSRNYSRAPRGRPPTFGSTIKLSKPKDNTNDTLGKRLKAPARPPMSKPAPKRKRAPSTSSEDLTSLDSSDSADDASDEDEDEDEDDDDDDEDELPAVQAPSRSKKTTNETGRKTTTLAQDSISIAGSMDSMFGDYPDYFDEDDDPGLSPEENRKRFEQKIFAESEDDDNVYKAVDDISDSDEEYTDGHVEEQELLAMLSEEDYSEADDLLNHIDGLSAYGFGSDSEASIHRLASSQGSDNETVRERRVHFALDGNPRQSLLLRMSQSPTITRALLPSAMPEGGISPHVDKRMLGNDLDDSDLTDDCLPEQAHNSPTNHVQSDKESSPSVSPSIKKAANKSPRRRGPRRGIFIDDGEKPSGILDPSGKFILMTNPHLLGEEFARRYGASQTSSPDLGFAELIEGSEAGDHPSDMIQGPTADIMLASLNSARNDFSSQGQAIGPLEAFYPSNIIQFGDYAIDPDDLEGDYIPDDDLGEDVINLEDVIQFDDASDDSDAVTSPAYMPSGRMLNDSSHGLSHLNNSNVTAFRRNADPAFAAFSHTPSYQDMDLFSSPYATPTPRRKRKHFSSPYTSSHYKGVTPVQRMRDPKHRPATPDTSTPAKRRKLMT